MIRQIKQDRMWDRSSHVRLVFRKKLAREVVCMLVCSKKENETKERMVAFRSHAGSAVGLRLLTLYLALSLASVIISQNTFHTAGRSAILGICQRILQNCCWVKIGAKIVRREPGVRTSNIKQIPPICNTAWSCAHHLLAWTDRLLVAGNVSYRFWLWQSARQNLRALWFLTTYTEHEGQFGMKRKHVF